MATMIGTTAGPLGRVIKEQRQLLGLTQREVGERAGISEGYVSRIEKGERTRLSESAATRLAQALQLDPLRVKKLAGMVTDDDLERFARRPLFEEVVRADPRLTEEQKRALLVFYQTAIRGGSASSA